MILSSSRSICPLLMVGLLLCPPAFAYSANTGATPRDRDYRLLEGESVSRSADTASAAAYAAQSAAGWINHGLNKLLIHLNLRSENAHIRSLLRNSGQPGVLYQVEIIKEQAEESETPVYEVLGHKALFVGAGTSPLAVFTAAHELHQEDLTPPIPKVGASLDADRSYFMWFTMRGTKINCKVIQNRTIIDQAAARFADQKLLDSLTAAEDLSALKAALQQMDKTLSSKKLHRYLAKLRKEQDETNRKIDQVETRLHNELQHEKRAEATEKTLSMISSVLTMASQVALVKESLGSDAPADIGSKTNHDQLSHEVKNLASNLAKGASAIKIEYQKYINKENGIERDEFNFLEEHKYPETSTPQLQYEEDDVLSTMH